MRQSVGFVKTECYGDSHNTWACISMKEMHLGRYHHEGDASDRATVVLKTMVQAGMVVIGIPISLSN